MSDYTLIKVYECNRCHDTICLALPYDENAMPYQIFERELQRRGWGYGSPGSGLWCHMCNRSFHRWLAQPKQDAAMGLIASKGYARGR
jgi:hypothetical protein